MPFHITKARALIHPKPSCILRELFASSLEEGCWMSVVSGKQNWVHSW